MSYESYLLFLFHLLDFAVGVLFCIDSYFIISTANTLPRAVLPVYYFIFGLIIITVVFYVPVIISNMLIFYWTFFGRSCTFLFLAAPLITFGSTLDIACGVYTAIVGFVYLISTVLTLVCCPVLSITLPPPLFQRDQGLPTPDTNKQSQQKKWQFKEKEKEKRPKKSRWGWKKKNDSAYSKQQSNDVTEATSDVNIKDRMAALSSDSELNEKLDGMKKEREKDIKTLDSEQKQQATEVLTQYADSKVAHIKDINALNAEIKDINRSNAVQKMINLGLMSHIFVKQDVFERYSSMNMYSNMLLNQDCNEIHANDEEYTKMYVLNMMNSALLTKLTAEQQIEFEKLLLYSLETADKLYMVELSRSNLNNVLLEKIMNVLIQRSQKENVFGPEMFHCDSNRITDTGMKFIIEYIAENDKDLKVIKAAHMFTTISSETCKLCGEVLEEKNKYLLKLSIDIQWAQYQTTIDKSLNRNNSSFREERNKKVKLSENVVVDDRKENDDVVVVTEPVIIQETIEIQTETATETDVHLVTHDNDIVAALAHDDNNHNMVVVDMDENNPFFNEDVKSDKEIENVAIKNDTELVIESAVSVVNNDEVKEKNDEEMKTESVGNDIDNEVKEDEVKQCDVNVQEMEIKTNVVIDNNDGLILHVDENDNPLDDGVFDGNTIDQTSQNQNLNVVVDDNYV